MHLMLAFTRRNNQFRSVFIPNRWLDLLTVPDFSLKMAAAGGVEKNSAFNKCARIPNMDDIKNGVCL